MHMTHGSRKVEWESDMNYLCKNGSNRMGWNRMGWSRIG